MNHNLNFSTSPRDNTTMRRSKSTNDLAASGSKSLKSSTDTATKEAPPQLPKSPYGTLTHNLRRFVPHKIACRIGCRGKKCKYDNSNWPAEDMAIPGIFSHWITGDIVATARPNNHLIKNEDLIYKMQKIGIRSIFNLQTRFEHKDCGYGLDKSGFSYDPLEFTKAGISYYNYELADFSIASLEKMLDMIKVLCFAITEGKVAIHCHAGLGRTGLFIACYLVYEYRMSAVDAIHYVRSKRQNTIQMKDQILAVQEFEDYLVPLRIIYAKISNAERNLEEDEEEERASHLQHKQRRDSMRDKFLPKVRATPFSLFTFLRRQKQHLHGDESRMFKYVPKILYTCGEQLLKIAQVNRSDGSTSARASARHDYDGEARTTVANALATKLYTRKVMKKLANFQTRINDLNEGMDDIRFVDDPLLVSALMWSWLDQLSEPVLRHQEIKIMLHESRKHAKISWRNLDPNTFNTMSYLAGLIRQLNPLPADLEETLIYQLLSFLTHSKAGHHHHHHHQPSSSHDDSDYDSYDRRRSSRLHTSDHYYDHHHHHHHHLTSFVSINEVTVKTSVMRELYDILQDLIHNPVYLSDSILGNFRFNKVLRGGGDSGAASDEYYHPTTEMMPATPRRSLLRRRSSSDDDQQRRRRTRSNRVAPVASTGAARRRSFSSSAEDLRELQSHYASQMRRSSSSFGLSSGTTTAAGNSRSKGRGVMTRRDSDSY